MGQVIETTREMEARYTSGVYSKRPVVIVRGEGALLWDEEGRVYIDCAAGHGAANPGHGRPEIAAAIAEQARRLLCCPEIVYNDTRARLLSRLATLVPLQDARLFLCNSGSEAIEGALKFARLATGRPGIVATLRGFHGRSMGALSATWEPRYRQPFAPLLPGITHVRYNDLADAQAAIGEETAAVLIELIQGEGGVHLATSAYIQGLAQLCHRRGALLIVDEVQTGFGRTGRLFACQHYELEPDILCLAKSLAGGIPMGAICLGRRVLEGGRIVRGVHGTTFGGNPVACAAALSALDILEREQLAERAAELGEYALERLRQGRIPLIREVRGRGLLLGIELTTKVQPYLEQLCARGVLALPAGPRVLRLLPPLVITRAHLEQALTHIEQVLSGESDAPAHMEIVPPEVALLQDMLRIPSYSGEEAILARYLLEQARALGLQAHIDAAGNLVAGAGLQSPERPVVLLGHMDTVRGVIPVRREGGRLYGRGAVDAKGPLATLLIAASRVARSGDLARPLLLIGAVEEETATSRGARAVLGRYQPMACIIGEPSGSEAITLGYKGRLIVEGLARRPLSHTAGPGRSSCELVAALWERARAQAQAWNSEHAGTSTFATLQPSLRTLTSQQDGLVEEATCVIGYRLPPDVTGAELRAQLEAWAAELEIKVSFQGEEPAFQSSRHTQLARAFVSALRARGVRPTLKLKTGTSDMNVVGPVWGDNIVAYGPGDAQLDHTPGEYLEIDEYLRAIEVLEDVLRTLTCAEGVAG